MADVDSDDSNVVLVEHNDAALALASAVPELTSEYKDTCNTKTTTTTKAKALQIVSIGTTTTEDNNNNNNNNNQQQHAFQFHQDKLDTILQEIPVDCPVAVLSVVGAFRTGKSFLLSWFLRYLHHLQNSSNNNNKDKKTATVSSSQQKQEQQQQQQPWYKEYQSLGNDGFEWKAGSDRNTTGIWMWSRPFYLPSSNNNNNQDNNNDDDNTTPPTALLLVDTQGMFDHETTMALTSRIFGISTLVSSFQIYNVDKRIQEDNLQQLALFSEYARIAQVKGKETETSSATSGNSNNNNNNNNSSSNNSSNNNTNTSTNENENSSEQEQQQHDTSLECPFQRMEFLVRDWQHFDDEEMDENNPPLDAMEASMMEYLNDVVKEREASDLKDTRTQIVSCFTELTCFGLCHPGFAVTKKKFTGDVTAMETLFVKLLDRYCQRVFSSIQPKKIHGRTLTAVELGNYIAEYAKLFASSDAHHFPPAVTLFQATATAQNISAVKMGKDEYTRRMDRVAGHNCTNYFNDQDLNDEHDGAEKAALLRFAEIATFGPVAAIQEAKGTLQDEIHESYKTYKSLNDERNPAKGQEVYLVPGVIVMVSLVVRFVLNVTCAPHRDVCIWGSEVALSAMIVAALFLGIAVLAQYHGPIMQCLRPITQQLLRALQSFFNVPQAQAAVAAKSKKE